MLLPSGETLLASHPVTVSALSPDPTSFSTRLGDRRCRGDAPVQGAHHVCGLSGDAGLQTTDLPGNSCASLALPGRTGLCGTSADGVEKDTDAGRTEDKAEFMLLPLPKARAVWSVMAAEDVPGEMVSLRLWLQAVVTPGYLSVPAARTPSGGAETSPEGGNGGRVTPSPASRDIEDAELKRRVATPSVPEAVGSSKVLLDTCP